MRCEGGMTERRNINCLTSLLNMANPGGGSEHEVGHAVDKALSCDRHVHCSQRLQCAWLASELAERLRVSGR